MNEDFLVMQGSAVKSLSDSGKVGGYLVLYGPDNTDLDGEYFRHDCDFSLEGRSLLPMLYDHGRSPVFKRQKLTHVRFENQKDTGIWIEGNLPIRESYKIEQVWEAVKADELGLSSGTSEHLMERVRRGHLNEIVNWPISEASLAKRPAQPKSRAVALKSLPLTDFDSLSDYHQTPEQKAAQIYADLIVSQHERRMKEFEKSLHGDDKAEEQAYYNALANMYKYKLDRIMRNLK